MEDPEKDSQSKFKKITRKDLYLGVFMTIAFAFLMFLREWFPPAAVIAADTHERVCISMINETREAINNLAPEFRELLKNVFACQDLRLLL